MESNLVRTAMNIFDCYVEEFTDEKAMEGITGLDLRAQLEVRIYNICFVSLSNLIIIFYRVYSSTLVFGLSEDV